MISIDNVYFSYGEKQVLSNFSLKIGAGERACLFGESGCGKTTLLRLILGLEKPESGSILLPEGCRMSAVFQENRLLPFKTVLQNITLMGADKSTAVYHLEALGIADSADKYPTELSGGMQRRAALARALAADYTHLILDEPFSGLDSNNINIAARHISDSLAGRTLILVSHSQSEAELLGAEIFKISENRE